MTRRIAKLENIRVRSPCGADWEAMAGDDRARFCRECDKKVYNLSAMTREQVASLISDRQGKLCARFSFRPDGTLLTLEPAAAPRAPRGRAPRAAAAAFTAVFGLCASAFAQSPARADESPARASRQEAGHANKQQAKASRKKAVKLHGTIRDVQASVITRAQVTLTNKATRKDRAVETDDEGVFIFDDLEDGSYTLVAQSPGFAPFTRQLELRAGGDVLLNVTLSAGLMGEIVFVHQPVVRNPALNFVIETLSLPYRGLKKLVKAVPR